MNNRSKASRRSIFRWFKKIFVCGCGQEGPANDWTMGPIQLVRPGQKPVFDPVFVLAPGAEIPSPGSTMAVPFFRARWAQNAGARDGAAPPDDLDCGPRDGHESTEAGLPHKLETFVRVKRHNRLVPYHMDGGIELDLLENGMRYRLRRADAGEEEILKERKGTAVAWCDAPEGLNVAAADGFDPEFNKDLLPFLDPYLHAIVPSPCDANSAFAVIKPRVLTRFLYDDDALREAVCVPIVTPVSRRQGDTTSSTNRWAAPAREVSFHLPPVESKDGEIANAA